MSFVCNVLFTTWLDDSKQITTIYIANLAFKANGKCNFIITYYPLIIWIIKGYGNSLMIIIYYDSQTNTTNNVL